MRQVTVLYTANPQPQSFNVDPSVVTFGALVNSLPDVKFSGMNVRLGGALYDVAHPDAILPDGNLKIFISVVDQKAAAYADDRAFLKATRAQAAQDEDEQLLELIGNYTHLTTAAIAELVEEVKDFLEARTNVVEEGDLAARVFEVEYKLGIRNTSNQAAFDARMVSEIEYTTQRA